MPKVQVPEYQSGVREAALPNVRLDTNAPIEAFGGGSAVAAGGAAGASLGREVSQLYENEKRQADDAATTEFYTKLASKKQELFWDPNAGVMARKGKDSFGALDEYGKKFDTYADELEAGLSTPEQRAIAKRIRQKERLEFDGQIQRHTFQEAQQFQSQTTKAGIEVARNEGVLNYADPEKIKGSLALQESLILKDAAGKPPALVQAEIQDMRSKTHSQIVSRMLANGQDLEAKKHYELNKDSFTSDDVTRVEQALQAGTLLGESQRQATGIMSQTKGDLKSALSLARQIEDPKVQEATIREIKTRHEESQGIKREFEEKRLANVFNHISATKKQVDPALFAALSPADKKNAEDWLAHVRRGTQPETDYAKFYELKTLASAPATRDAFMKMNLMEVRSSMANTEFKELIDLQTAMRKGDSSADKLLDGYRTDSEIVNSTLSAAGIDPTPKAGSSDAMRVATFRSMVDEQIRERQRVTGKKVTNEEVQSITDNLIIKGVTQKGLIWDTKKRAFELKPGEQIDVKPEDVPQAERRKIEDALRRRGIPISDKTVSELYNRKINSQVNRGAN